MSKYKAIDGQSIFDICLQTYGSLDFLQKLIDDSGFDNANASPYSGQEFSYDDDLLVDQLTGGSKGSKLATLYSPAKAEKGPAQSLTLITKVYATGFSKPTESVIINSNMYQKTESDSYTAGADNETVINLPEWIGWDLLAVELEIKPLRKSEYGWNKSSGTFSLQGGVPMTSGQTLFFLFQKMTS
jgi:hypothetical protein